MRASLWIVDSGARVLRAPARDRSRFLLASRSAYAGPGLPIGHDDTVYPDELAEASPPRRVDVTITDQGPQPRDIQVDGGEKLQVVLTRASQKACRSDVLVPDYDLRTQVPAGHPVALTLLTQGRGQVHLSCPLEDAVGALDVR